MYTNEKSIKIKMAKANINGYAFNVHNSGILKFSAMNEPMIQLKTNHNLNITYLSLITD